MRPNTWAHSFLRAAEFVHCRGISTSLFYGIW